MFNIIDIILLEKTNPIINQFIQFSHIITWINMVKCIIYIGLLLCKIQLSIVKHETFINQQTYIDCYCQRMYVYKLCNYTQHSLKKIIGIRETNKFSAELCFCVKGFFRQLLQKQEFKNFQYTFLCIKLYSFYTFLTYFRFVTSSVGPV